MILQQTGVGPTWITQPGLISMVPEWIWDLNGNNWRGGGGRINISGAAFISVLGEKGLKSARGMDLGPAQVMLIALAISIGALEWIGERLICAQRRYPQLPCF